MVVRVGQLAEIGNRLGSWAVRNLLTSDASRRLAAVLYRALGTGEVEPDDPRGFWLTRQQLGRDGQPFESPFRPQAGRVRVCWLDRWRIQPHSTARATLIKSAQPGTRRALILA